MTDRWRVKCSDGEKREIDPRTVRDFVDGFRAMRLEMFAETLGIGTDEEVQLEAADAGYLSGYVEALNDLAQLCQEMLDSEAQPDGS